ncbi:NAD(P)H-dependent oxidoreductase [Candidatus Saccharibacteria bacterium]|nr:NAD(P)H-dependent oxidoreductase [Candidatus Saccharibacteria bacterium]
MNGGHIISKLYIPVLAGTTREQRKSIHAARLVAEVGATFEDVETEVIDPKDFHFPGDGNDPEGQDPRYSALTERADGFFIVTPEYNHSMPGSLKRMLDSELKNYIHKPVAFAGASSGQWGGVRAIESLVSPVREMGLVATFTDMQFPNVQDLFDDEGHLLNENYREYVKAAWIELIWMTKVMQYGRENITSKHHAD